MQQKHSVTVPGLGITFSTGTYAKFASGAVNVSVGETNVFVTATIAQTTKPGQDWFPLTVDYQERTYAAGKIPGGFFKREGRPPEREILTSRLVDRALRPLFPEGFFCETQVVASVLSVDRENDADTIAMIGASAALQVSDIPFRGPIAGVRVGRLRGKLTVNPLQSQFDQSDINLFVAAGRDAIIMVEGGAKAAAEPTIETRLVPEDAKAGDVVTLEVTARIPKGSYTYSATRSDDLGGSPTTIVVETKGLEALDEAFTPDHEPTRELEPAFGREVEKHKKDVTWSRKYRISSNEPQDVRVSGMVR